eukprot:GEMP01107432.1.p1 GENE.GEMP01107432.1~~GEMP01107432.1.p1  ORF type:complete len:113 (+),score=4.99 GEMP01107432.1:114-452(+)
MVRLCKKMYSPSRQLILAPHRESGRVKTLNRFVFQPSTRFLFFAVGGRGREDLKSKEHEKLLYTPVVYKQKMSFKDKFDIHRVLANAEKGGYRFLGERHLVAFVDTTFSVNR